MIENTSINQIAERVAERTAESQQSVVPKATDLSDAARFQEALNGAQQTAPVEAPAESAAIEANPVMPAESGPGDSILQSLQGMRSDYQKVTGKVANLTQADSKLSMQDLLRAQMELNRVSMQVDLAAKGVGKVTQGIETLAKSQ